MKMFHVICSARLLSNKRAFMFDSFIKANDEKEAAMIFTNEFSWMIQFVELGVVLARSSTEKQQFFVESALNNMFNDLHKRKGELK